MVLRFANASSNDTDTTRFFYEGGFVLTALIALGLVMASRAYWSLRVVLVSYAIGLTIGAAANLATISDNPFKYGFSLPLALVVLSLLDSAPKFVAVVTLLALSGVGFAFSYRSFGIFCVLTALIFIWGNSRTNQQIVHRGPVNAVVLTATTVVIYFSGTSLLVNGALGEANAERSIAQITTSGNLLVGGRPEWTASIALMQYKPLGLGLGAVPNSTDLAVAQNGLFNAGINAFGPYYTEYMFGQYFRLHSIIADLWVSFGPLGLLLGLLALSTIGYSIILQLRRARVCPTAVFLALTSAWFLCFGPIDTNLPYVAVSAGVLLSGVLRASETSERRDAALTSTHIAS